MKKVTTTIYWIVMAVVLAFAVLVIVPALPLKNNYKLLVVRSGSMEPAIKTGSVVMALPSSEYNQGDVLTFKSAGFEEDGKEMPVTHRIVEIVTEDGVQKYRTKGDANENSDPKLIGKQNVIGKVVLTIPYMGCVVEGARSRLGFMALILIPALIIVWDQAKNIIAEMRKMKATKKEEEST